MGSCQLRCWSGHFAGNRWSQTGLVHAAGRPLPAGIPRTREGSRCWKCAGRRTSAPRSPLPGPAPGVDAAIFFSDIVTPLEDRHRHWRSSRGWPGDRGTIQERSRPGQLRPLEPDTDLPEIAEAIRIVTAELGDTPLIGFAGAVHPGQLPGRGPALEVTGNGPDHAAGGTGAVQTCSNALPTSRSLRFARRWRPGGYQTRCRSSTPGPARFPGDLPGGRPAGLKGSSPRSDLGVPRIHFAVNAGHLMEAMAEASSDAMGVDWRTPLSRLAASSVRRCLTGQPRSNRALAGPEVLEARPATCWPTPQRVMSSIWVTGSCLRPTHADRAGRPCSRITEKEVSDEKSEDRSPGHGLWNRDRTG